MSRFLAEAAADAKPADIISGADWTIKGDVKVDDVAADTTNTQHPALKLQQQAASNADGTKYTYQMNLVVTKNKQNVETAGFSIASSGVDSKGFANWGCKVAA